MIPRKAGIYLIRNTAAGRSYVGQTEELRRRRDEHFSLLRTGAHRNRLLQADFKQYGERAFVFEVLEECAPRLLDEREHYWIAEFRCIEDGYNIKPSPNEDRTLQTRRSAQNYELEPVVVQLPIKLKRNLEELVLHYKRQGDKDRRSVAALIRLACDDMLRRDLPGYEPPADDPAPGD